MIRRFAPLFCSFLFILTGLAFVTRAGIQNDEALFGAGIFDQTGSDPDSRGGGSGGGGGGGGVPRGTTFTGFQGAEISPEDLFNMFFAGGGMGGGGFGGGPFGDAGGPFAFGGPGIRVHQFGGAGPRMRRRTAAGATGQAQPTDANEQQTSNPTRIFWNLLPLLLFFLLPMLTGLFGGGDETLRGPAWSMEEKGRFTHRRETPKYGVPFFVDPKEMDGLGMRDVTKLGARAEAGIVNSINNACSR